MRQLCSNFHNSLNLANGQFLAIFTKYETTILLQCHNHNWKKLQNEYSKNVDFVHNLLIHPLEELLLLNASNLCVINFLRIFWHC